MSNNSHSGNGSSKKSSQSTRSGKPAGRPGSKFSRPRRGGSAGAHGRPGGRSGGQSKRPVKKFDPSLFVKKVEETTPAAVYAFTHASFSDFSLVDQLKQNIIDRGYKSPTPIQDQTIPILLEGKDVVGTANTGTGKTAAFLIPLVNNVLTKKTNRVLIIAPTRELADQIQSELELFTINTGIASALCIGGSNIDPQIRRLNTNPEFVIGTPGRLMDLEEQGALNFRLFDAIVLDEVDTMLDMGFLKNITHIVSRLPRNRHSLFFSATISPEIKKVIDRFLKDPVFVSVKTRQSAENVNQDVVRVKPNKKIDTIHDILIKPEVRKSIIFLRTKRAVDKLARALSSRGFNLVSMHGDKTQAQRNKALDAFKENKVRILLATDVVARGIDIDDVTHVINYDLPQTHEDYIHRIGRTGRADKIGQAITFIEE